MFRHPPYLEVPWILMGIARPLDLFVTCGG